MQVTGVDDGDNTEEKHNPYLVTQEMSLGYCNMNHKYNFYMKRFIAL